MKRKILIADNSTSFLERTTDALVSCGYEILSASNGRQTVSLAESHCPDLIMINDHLSDVDGPVLISEIREWSEVPIIVMSPSGYHEAEAVSALDSGADDYIHYGIGKNEILSRIRVAFRHSVAGRETLHKGKLSIGGLTIDYNKYRVFIAEKDAGLTLNEFKIVALLGKYAGKVLTYDYILTQLWGPNAIRDNQILRVNMTNIRKKLGESSTAPRYIVTEPGIGYRMRTD